MYQHGTYDHHGRFHPQVVNLGVTQSGIPGLFSGGMLAWPLTAELHQQFVSHPELLRPYVELRGFVLEE